ncbi:MAG: hypothetical protein AAB353_00135 [Candidatus Hydrogenedentota bacterium]
MEKAGAVALTFFIAFLVSYFDRITTNYPNTARFIWRSLYLIGYAAMYALASALVLLGLGALIDSGSLTLEGSGVGNIWIQAIFIGLSAKAALNINLATFNGVPIGVQTLIYPLERFLLSSLEGEAWNQRQEFITRLVVKYTRLDEVKQTAKSNIPPQIANDEDRKDAYLRDVESKQTVPDLLDFIIREIDARTFNRIFPAS